jgi:hypothetical protein
MSHHVTTEAIIRIRPIQESGFKGAKARIRNVLFLILALASILTFLPHADRAFGTDVDAGGAAVA